MSLSQRIGKRILSDGPLSLTDFMEAALADPDFGYYMTRDPFGTRGDFITAPEISQIFGELIGLWCAALWLQLDKPKLVHLAELGPGRGTLMVDALRAAKSVPGFAQALQVHLVEMSPQLKKIQQQTLENSGHSIHWHRHIEDLPQELTFFIANEFFDALPIQQFIHTDKGWCERLVRLNSNDDFEFTPSAIVTSPEDTGISPQLLTAPVGSLVETCQPAQDIIKNLSTRIQAHGGAALIIDYGYLRPATGETLQAVSDHKFADVLQNPGEQDLTAHVNFSSLAHAARQTGAQVFGPLTQAQFLTGLGIDARLAGLTKTTTAAQTHDIKTATHRLIAADQMGTLFKVMAITASNNAPPAPFT
jgi:NADH dehydrogenase [ubiquinone] 1 alpha subcomplex assembly factor 7